MTTKTESSRPDARINPKNLLDKSHPSIVDMPMLGEDDLKALTESILNHGVMKPISLSHDGLVVDGRNRAVASVRAGLTSVPVIYLDVSVDVASYALESAVTGRNLTRSGIVLMLYLKHPGLAEMRSDRKGGRPSKEKGQETADKISSFRDIADKYNVPAEYFTRLAHIHEQCDNETWLSVQRSILDRETSIPAMVAGLAGKQATDGKKRRDPDYLSLTIRTATTLKNIFANWGSVKIPPKWHDQVLNNFGDSIRHMPPDIKVVTIAAIKDWPQHDKNALIKALK